MFVHIGNNFHGSDLLGAAARWSAHTLLTLYFSMIFKTLHTLRTQSELSIRTSPSIVIFMITELNERSREIFRYIVSSYLDTGSPIGSRTISKALNLSLSPASIRNTMADLEEMGLLAAPHVSAGRLPTERGLRLYIDGLMEIGGLSKEERARIEAECTVKGFP